MTDLEMTKLCAEAMGYEWNDAGGVIRLTQYLITYDPLLNDAHVMALVKKFHIHIDTLSDGMWSVDAGWLKPGDEVEDFDLNRAIVECVAKMQAGK